jgi:UDP-N-acetylmuramate dehydrogenase
MDYNGKIKTLHKKEIRFAYRSSGLQKYIILSAHLKLKKKNKALIQNRIREYLCQRKASQDLSRPSAGSVFKNPAYSSAGRLIDLCGLKGKSIGDARISCKHANFILNLGRAKARDVLKLIALIKKEVKKKFHVILEPEIKIWP